MQPYGCPAHPNLSANSRKLNYFLITVKPRHSGIFIYKGVLQCPKKPQIRVLYVQPGKYPEERVIEHTLAAMQTLVGGDIEAVYPWENIDA